MITETGRCAWNLSAMIREGRPGRPGNGGHFRSIEATGEYWFYCSTHDVEEYGPKAEVLAAAARHCPEIDARSAG